MLNKIREFYDNYLPKLKTKNNRHDWVCVSIDRLTPKGTKVLDIGCGAGIISKHLATGNRQVVAIDLSPKLIEYARKHNGHENIVYIPGDVCDLPEDKFDVIVMVDVLEHIQMSSISKLLNVLADVSHENTMIYLNIPHHDVLKFLKRNKPDNLQIVDNPIDDSTILGFFKYIKFVPCYFRMYWGQYVEYLFVTEKQRNDMLRKAFLLQ